MRGNASEKLTEAGYNQEKETEASILSTSPMAFTLSGREGGVYEQAGVFP